MADPIPPLNTKPRVTPALTRYARCGCGYEGITRHWDEVKRERVCSLCADRLTHPPAAKRMEVFPL